MVKSKFVSIDKSNIKYFYFDVCDKNPIYDPVLNTGVYHTRKISAAYIFNEEDKTSAVSFAFLNNKEYNKKSDVRTILNVRLGGQKIALRKLGKHIPGFVVVEEVPPFVIEAVASAFEQWPSEHKPSWATGFTVPRRINGPEEK